MYPFGLIEGKRNQCIRLSWINTQVTPSAPKKEKHGGKRNFMGGEAETERVRQTFDNGGSSSKSKTSGIHVVLY